MVFVRVRLLNVMLIFTECLFLVLNIPSPTVTMPQNSLLAARKYLKTRIFMYKSFVTECVALNGWWIFCVSLGDAKVGMCAD